MIILATITLNIVFNENGIIKQTENAKSLQDMEKERERLEMIKGQTAIGNAGKVTVDLYIEELKKENITVDGEITDNGDGSKTVITDTGYSVLIKPNGENDIIIEIEGTVGKLKARIVSVKAIQKGSKIQVEVEAKRAEGAMYKYYYKTKNGEYPINPVVQGKNKVTCEITGVSEQEEYVIKVEIDNGNGVVSKEVYLLDEDELAVAPKLSEGMIPVKWNGTNWEKTTKEDEEWYKYSKRSKKWANIVLGDATFNKVEGKEVLDESKAYTQLVWIPRYAYKITSMYHMNGDANTAGNIEVVFIDSQNKDKKGVTYSETYPTYSEGVAGAMTDYVVHPAFNYGSSKLDGIWVGKYETSHTNGSTGYSGNEVMQIKANVTSWRNIKVSDIYIACINMNKEGNVYGLNTSDSVVDPHMLKNSEWGAVAYLSKSKYGKETEEVYINNNSIYITGIAGDTATSGESLSTTNTYNTEKGQKASTTGNIYGVYDMSGGADEYVAGYVANGNENLTSYGEKLISAPDKHKDVYKSNGDTQAGNYSVANAGNGKYGDAVYETSNYYNSSSDSWYADYSKFAYSSWPFFVRGAWSGGGSGTGMFCFSSTFGIGSLFCGFHVAVPVL